MSAFGKLIDEYEDAANLFKLSQARELFLQKMISEDPLNEVPSEANKEETEKVWNQFLEKIELCQKYSAEIDKENKTLSLKRSYENVNFTERIDQMSDELNKIEREQRAVDSLIEKRTQRQKELLKEREETIGLDEEKSVCIVDDSFKAESIRLKSLLSGLEAITQLHLKSVSNNEKNGDIILQCKIGDVDTMLVLDESRRLCNLTVDSSFINSADVLNEAQQLSPPQDFRHAIFFIGAVQKSPTELKKDVDHLRKKYIVQMDTNKQGVFSITFSNGMTIEMAAHPCYPYVPNSVKITEISGIGDWNTEELQHAKFLTNTSPVATASAAVDRFVQILESKN